MNSNRKFKEISAIYFDLDDTLCNYWHSAKTALKNTFEKIAPAEVSTDQMLRAWEDSFKKFYSLLKDSEWYARYLLSGESTRTEQMRLALQLVHIDNSAMAQELSDFYGAERLRLLELFPQAKQVLESLYKKYPLGVITNGPADVQNHELDQLEIRNYFSYIFIEGEQGIGKPNQVVFENAQKAIGKLCHEILMIGNSYEHDIIPAIKMGWKTIWIDSKVHAPFASTHSAPKINPDFMPDAIIQHIGEATDLII